MSLLGRLQRLWASDNGNTTVTFALALLPLVGFVGAAIDYSRANMTRTRMQAALDSTALALAKSAATLNREQLQRSANSYFGAVFNGARLQNVSVTPRYNAATSTLTVTGSGTMSTDLLGIVGLKVLNIASTSTVSWGATKLRVALVLDNTGSMNDWGKLDALKTASHQLLAQLQSTSSNAGDAQVAIVPFTTDVNVGTSYANASWIDWSSWSASGTIENGMACSSGTASSSASSGGLLGSFSGNPFGFGPPPAWPPSSVAAWGGISLLSPFGSTCGDGDHSSWNGCVMDRNQSYDVQSSAPSGSADLFPADQSSWCPLQMVPLTSDWGTLNSAIDAMVANGATNQTIGLVWGWQALTSTAPLNAPAPPADTRQVVILLTDGLNTQNRWSIIQSEIDARTAQVCSNIKAAGIMIYTVLVMSGDSSILQTCASDASKYFALTQSNQIVTTFNQIASSLTQLHIAR